jgi:hypothetical protein
MSKSLLVGTLLLWAGLRVTFYIGYYMEDAPGFVADAVSWASGTWQPRTSLPGLRIGTYIPAGMAMALFGKTEIAISVWGLVSSLAGLLAFIGICARLGLGRWRWLAALLWAAYPGDVLLSTVLMPDAIQTGWFLVAIYLAVAGCTGQRKMAALAASGAALGGCYLIRENALILAPVVVATPLLIGRHDGPLTARLRQSLMILGGLLTVAALEAMYYGIVVGDPGRRLTVAHDYYGGPDSLARHGLNVDPWTIPGSLLPPLEWIRTGLPPMALHSGQAYHAYAFVLALLAWLAALPMAVRMTDPERRAFAWMSLWVWWPVLYHQFGSQSVTSFVPMHRLSRQLILYGPGAVMVVAWVAAHVAKHGGRPPMKAAAAVVLVAGLVVHAGGVLEGLGLQSAIISRTTTIHDRLVANLIGYRGRVFIDSAEVGLIDYFLNPLGAEPVVHVQDVFSATSCGAFEGAIVVTHSNPGWSFQPPPILLGDAQRRLPCLAHPPPTWTPLHAAAWLPERIYSVTQVSPAAGASGSSPE